MDNFLFNININDTIKHYDESLNYKVRTVS